MSLVGGQWTPGLSTLDPGEYQTKAGLLVPGSGFALQNATPYLLVYLVPNDGRLHSYLITGALNVTGAMTGGAVNVGAPGIGGGLVNQALFAGGLAVGNYGALVGGVVLGGYNIIVNQTALTAGAATFYGAISLLN